MVCIVFLSLTSCLKDKVEHPFAGTYDCQVQKSYWDNSGESADSVFQKAITITSEEDTIDVLGARIHENNVEYGKTISFSAGFNYMNFRFEPDSVYINLHYGGSGSISSTAYAGRKTN